MGAYLSKGIVHALTDVLVELLVGDVAEGEFTVHAVFLGGADDTAGNDDGDVADAADVGVEPVLCNFFWEEGG